MTTQQTTHDKQHIPIAVWTCKYKHVNKCKG